MKQYEMQNRSQKNSHSCVPLNKKTSTGHKDQLWEQLELQTARPALLNKISCKQLDQLQATSSLPDNKTKTKTSFEQ
jgi:hypothetical protein